MKQEKSCGCIVLKDEKVLLVKHQKGHWGFPKGHTEGNETELETAIRETKEETGIMVQANEDDKFAIEYETDKGNYKRVVYFIAKEIGGNLIPQEGEILNVEWTDMEIAVDKITFDNTREILKRVMKGNRKI